MTYCNILKMDPATERTMVLEPAKKLENLRPGDELFNSSIMGYAWPIALAIYAATEPAPQRLILASPGGTAASGEMMGWIVNKFMDTEVVVPNGLACVSACVAVLSGVERRTVEPGGYLLFHAGNNDPRWIDCEPCNFVRAHWPFIGTSEAERHVMLPWARKISPRLEDFLKSCSVNPLDSHEGIALSGSQIDQIRQGTAEFRCDDLREQNLTWMKKKLGLRSVPYQRASATTPSE